MPFTFMPMTAADTRAILDWHYAAPYDFYNSAPQDAAETIATFLEPDYNYYVLLDDARTLVAFCCFGDDAQVTGGDYDADALDIGLGLRPDLTGRGDGAVYFSAVCDFAWRKWQPALLRLTVATFNQRALRLYEHAGFQRVQEFQRGGDGVAFFVLTNTPSFNQRRERS